MPTEATRAYLYRIILAALLLASVKGLVAGDELDEWTDLAIAILGLGGTGLATLNTSTKRS